MMFILLSEMMQIRCHAGKRKQMLPFSTWMGCVESLQPAYPIMDVVY